MNTEALKTDLETLEFYIKYYPEDAKKLIDSIIGKLEKIKEGLDK